jgi:hypothetical protein
MSLPAPRRRPLAVKPLRAEGPLPRPYFVQRIGTVKPAVAHDLGDRPAVADVLARSLFRMTRSANFPGSMLPISELFVDPEKA